MNNLIVMQEIVKYCIRQLNKYMISSAPVTLNMNQ